MHVIVFFLKLQYKVRTYAQLSALIVEARVWRFSQKMEKI